MQKKNLFIAGALALLMSATPALAKVSADEAAKLGKELTPMGSEKAGNADGTIPAWEGGLTKPHPDWKAPNGHRPDPFPQDKPQFTITAQNMDKYADKLTDGQKALLKMYPDSFKMDIYPTRRTAALPQWFLDNTKKNATVTELVDGGNGIQNFYAGIPFPIPQNGVEVYWNHRTRYQGPSSEATQWEMIIQPNGTYSTEVITYQDHKYPFHRTGNTEMLKDEYLFMLGFTTLAPASEKGKGIVALDSYNDVKSPRKAWLYTPAERRVRRAPALSFDSPDKSITTYDQWDMWNGSPERYDFKLVGKKEIFLPYNEYRMTLPSVKSTDVMPAKHINTDYVRNELRRVWVVEATVKEGARHIYAKRVAYFDEDSYNLLAVDMYDNAGNLWRVQFAHTKQWADVPAYNWGVITAYDLKNRVWYLLGLTNEMDVSYDWTSEPPEDNYFTPAAMRRRGR